MHYLLLIQEPRGQREQRQPAEGRKLYAAMQDFAAGLQAEGRLRAVESLLRDDHGRRVQVRDGRTRVVDGPFTEAKEMVGGFFLVDCDSFDDACRIAERCPAAAFATVEVRAAGPCFD